MIHTPPDTRLAIASSSRPYKRMPILPRGRGRRSPDAAAMLRQYCGMCNATTGEVLRQLAQQIDAEEGQYTPSLLAPYLLPPSAVC